MPRGKTSKLGAEKIEYLESHWAEFQANQPHLTTFWKKVERGWFVRWKVEAELGLPIPQTEGVSIEDSGLTPEEEAAVGEAQQVAKGVIHNWFNNKSQKQKRLLNGGGSLPAKAAVLKEFMAGVRGKRGRKRHRVEIFQKRNPKIIEEALKETEFSSAMGSSDEDETVEERKMRIKTGRSTQFALRKRVATEQWELASEEEKAAVEQLYQNQERPSGAHIGKAETPEEMQQGLERIGPILKDFHSAITDFTGWVGTTVITGPIPNEGGKIGTQSYCHGVTPGGRTLDQAVAGWDDNVIKPLQQFGKSVFDHKTRRERAIKSKDLLADDASTGEDSGQVSGEAMGEGQELEPRKRKRKSKGKATKKRKSGTDPSTISGTPGQAPLGLTPEFETPGLTSDAAPLGLIADLTIDQQSLFLDGAGAFDMGDFTSPFDEEELAAFLTTGLISDVPNAIRGGDFVEPTLRLPNDLDQASFPPFDDHLPRTELPPPWEDWTLHSGQGLLTPSASATTSTPTQLAEFLATPPPTQHAASSSCPGSTTTTPAITGALRSAAATPPPQHPVSPSGSIGRAPATPTSSAVAPAPTAHAIVPALRSAAATPPVSPSGSIGRAPAMPTSAPTPTTPTIAPALRSAVATPPSQHPVALSGSIGGARTTPTSMAAVPSSTPVAPSPTHSSSHQRGTPGSAIRKSAAVNTPSPLRRMHTAPAASAAAPMPALTPTISMVTTTSIPALTPENFPVSRPMSNPPRGPALPRGRPKSRGRGGSKRGRGGRAAAGVARDESVGGAVGGDGTMSTIPRERMKEIRAFEKARDDDEQAREDAATRTARERDHGIYVFAPPPPGHEALHAAPAALGTPAIRTEPQPLHSAPESVPSMGLGRRVRQPTAKAQQIQEDAAKKKERGGGVKRKANEENMLPPVTKNPQVHQTRRGTQIRQISAWALVHPNGTHKRLGACPPKWDTSVITVRPPWFRASPSWAAASDRGWLRQRAAGGGRRVAGGGRGGGGRRVAVIGGVLRAAWHATLYIGKL
ncbi:hypothetical protein B0H12DRAFT_1070012 [Mycena haematopus]|nr:hypothetical protein B0H12DRAFT_1070012 [Mycena haematopus]